VAKNAPPASRMPLCVPSALLFETGQICRFQAFPADISGWHDNCFPSAVFNLEGCAVMSSLAREGLCAECGWAASCTIPADSDEPIVSCAYFERIDVYERRKARDAEAINRPDPSRMEGLCADCANRGSCMFRREGGTWHCEEYA